MSQPITGDRGEGFPSIIHGQPYPAGQGSSEYSNFIPYGQDRSAYVQNGNYFPVKPTNPHMAAGMRPHMQMHTAPVNQLQDANSIHHQQQPAHPQFIAGVNYGRSQEFNPHYQQMQNNQYFHIPGQQQQYHYFQNNQNFQISRVMPNHVNTHTFQQTQQNIKSEQPNQSISNQYYNSVNTCVVDPMKQDTQIKSPEIKAVKYDGSANSSPTNDSCSSVCNTSHDTDISVNECFVNTPKVKNSYNIFQGSSPNVPPVNNTLGNRPRANSRCDSTRSEAAESTCSSLSTESSNENPQHHGQFHLYPNNYSNPYVNSHCFPIAQMQNLNSPNENESNNNMGYQNNTSGYTRTNSVINKVSSNADQSLMQNFHHVDTVQQVQTPRGQLQIMQAQYQYLHGYNMGGPRPNMGMNHMQVGSVNQTFPGNVITPQGMNIGQNVCNMPNYCAVNRQDQFSGHTNFASPARMPLPPQHNMMRLPHLQSCPPQMMRMPQTTYPQCDQRFVPPSGAKLTLPPAIIVPFGWKRVNNNGQVVYMSPSGVNLHNVGQVVEYLTQEGTCKCGLQCPLRIETSFSFDPKVPHRAMMPSELALNDIKLCNHRRKLALSFDVQKQVKKEDGRKKRKRKTKNEESIPCSATTSSETAQLHTFTAPVQDAQIASHINTQMQLTQKDWNNGISTPKSENMCKTTECMHVPNGETSAATTYPQQDQCCTSAHQACTTNNFYANPGFIQRNECALQNQNQLPVLHNQPYPMHCRPSNYYNTQICHPAAPGMVTEQPDSVPFVNKSSSPSSELLEKKKKVTGRSKKKRKLDNVKPVVETSQYDVMCKTPDTNVPVNSYLGQQCSSGNGGPSFMEDPNGYLAQQTALLNNTMSGGGVGQFSPQGPGKCSVPFTKSSTVPVSDKSTVSLAGKIIPSPAVVPLPSNVPLPARVSKGMTSTTITTDGRNSCVSQAQLPSSVQPSVADSSCNSNMYQKNIFVGNEEKCSTSIEENSKSSVATVESSCASHIVTVTYTSSVASTSTCKSDVVTKNITFSNSDNSTLTSVIESLPRLSSGKFSDAQTSLDKSANLGSTTTGRLCSKLLDSDEANRPLIPGTFSSAMNTQSPLEMVQNIVSSIPVPASVEDSRPTSRASLTPQYKQLTSETSQTTSHHVVTPQLFNVAGNGNLTSVMYNTTGMIRAPTPLMVHGSNQSSMPSGMLVNTSGTGGNVMVVTSPFNAKGQLPVPTVCSTVSGVGPVVGIQSVPQVQVQPSLRQVQPHQFQPQMQQIQPVVQLVNTFATMQTPVIIQNGSNILQQTPGVISNQGGVLCPRNIIPSSGATFVAGQPILPASTISVGSSQTTPVLKMVSPNSEDGDQGVAINRLTPVQFRASTVTTPFSTPGSSGSDTPSSSSGGGSGRKRKKRNSPTQVSQPQNIMPAIIMGKQIQQSLVMNSTQIPQMSPYNTMTVPQVATVATVGNASATNDSSILHSTAHRTNAINVVQMVSGQVAGTLPVQVQQAPAIIVPSAAPSGFIINQLSDGSFVSTDPQTGMSYPVQIQLSGSHIVGVSPLAPANGNSGVISQFSASTGSTGNIVALNAMREAQPSATGETKVVNFSPAAAHPGINVYHVPTNISPTAASSATQYVSSEQINHQNSSLQQLTSSSSATVVQQKTTIVAQQTTVVATQGCLSGTHSSVSTQTPGALGESDVTSSDSTVVEPIMSREASTSPSHQSAEITTTRQDEETLSSPECQPCTPPHKMNPVSNAKFIENSQMVSNGPTVSVVYGHHRSHAKWPGQVLNQVGGRVILQWFGDRIVESVLTSSVSKCPPCISTITRSRFREKNFLLAALTEADSVSGHVTYRATVPSTPCIPDLNHNQITSQPVKPKRKRKTR